MSPLFETERHCIKLPYDVSPTSGADSPRYLSIVHHADRPATVFGAGLAFYRADEVISHVCTDRAPLTLDGRLQVQRRRLSPEAYIGKWRTALAVAMPIDKIFQRLRMRPFVVLSWEHSDVIADAKARWRDPPYACLRELLQVHAAQMTLPDEGGRSQLAIDLAAPNGARDAWWAQDFLSYRFASGHEPEIRIELRSPGPGCSHIGKQEALEGAPA